MHLLQGTNYVYETFFRPYISQHENDIDRNILESRARASDMLIIYWQKSATLGQNTLFSILKYIAALQSPSQLSRPHSSQVRE
jgi:receptor expression-enhancing protein 1/2/3/4